MMGRAGRLWMALRLLWRGWRYGEPLPRTAPLLFVAFTDPKVVAHGFLLLPLAFAYSLSDLLPASLHAVLLLAMVLLVAWDVGRMALRAPSLRSAPPLSSTAPCLPFGRGVSPWIAHLALPMGTVLALFWASQHLGWVAAVSWSGDVALSCVLLLVLFHAIRSGLQDSRRRALQLQASGWATLSAHQRMALLAAGHTPPLPPSQQGP